MKRIRVSSSVNYDVCIGRNILDNAGELTKEVKKPCRVMIVTDDNVAPLYLERVKKSFELSGFSADSFVFENGEASKNICVLEEILEALANKHFTRSDMCVALGGGVCGDITGFAASCYLRGIDFVQIPTTYLAAVDSSVGGKTAVNLKAGKNLMGAFYQPALVVCDIEVFKTLPYDVFADGIAETIKYGAICDKSLFELLRSGGLNEHIDDIVARCVEIKAEIVGEDEFDKGMRQLLNFGHTIGHAIEKVSGFSVTHGHAVAMGMVIISYAFSESIAKEIAEVCKMYKLPVKCGFEPLVLYDSCTSDKKRTGDKITLVVPEAVGKCVLHKTDITGLIHIIEKGMAYEC